jgi:putative glutamine amidotransferase
MPSAEPAVPDPASVNVVARASDGTVEGIDIPDARGWFLGVQWHPERTKDATMGDAILARLIEAARASVRRPPLR